MKNFKLIGYVTLVLALTGVASVQAEDDTQPPPHRNAFCKADVEKFCSDVEKGQRRIAQCLHEHKDELSQQCQDHMHKMRERHEAMKKACGEDKDKFCADVQPGHGNMRECFEKNKDKLSAECKGFVGQMKNRPHHPQEKPAQE